ncbi:MAG: serine/threonine protein kinase [Gemmatimonadaceae bacterium]|nr:serine/threonine protein kinase [Gemmatimonadaceae bacterium]
MKMNVSPSSDTIGTLVPGALVLGGRYRVERLLGAGGMGAVYLITHVSLNEPRALKVVHPDVLRDEGALMRFRREAQVQSRVRHPNVITVHDFGESADSNVWMVLEYADGIPLDELLSVEGPLSPERTATIMLGVCRGVEAAHAVGIIHRDLKPGNILITRGQDGREIAKVLDFGIARPLSIAGAPSSAVARLTSTNVFVGTPAYLSPDQLTETTEQPLDARSDVYTIGLIVTELLTGAVPTRSATIAEILQRTMQPVPSLRSLRSDVDWPAAVEAAVARAVHLDRCHRTASAQEFADEFCHAVITAELGSASKIFPEWTPRAVLAVKGTSGTTTPAVPAASLQGSAPTPSVSRSSRSLAIPITTLLTVIAATALWLTFRFADTVVSQPPRDSLATSGAVALGGSFSVGRSSVIPPLPEGAAKQPPVEYVSVGRGAEALDSASRALTAAPAPPEATAVDVAAFLAAAEREAGDDATLRTRLREADALMPLLTGRADSVAIGYVALEAEVLLARDTAACRRLQWLRGRSAGSRFAAAISLMADSLPCAR